MGVLILKLLYGFLVIRLVCFRVIKYLPFELLRAGLRSETERRMVWASEFLG